jgi:hypothetical protein
MEERTSGTQRLGFGGLPHEVRSAVLQFAAEGEIVKIEEQTYCGHTLYEVDVEPPTYQSFRLLLASNGAFLQRVFTGKHGQEAAPGCWG